MSRVHDNLRRDEETSPVPPADAHLRDVQPDAQPDLPRSALRRPGTGSSPVEEDSEALVREVRRKERLLTEGIRQLQNSVDDLSRDLETARQNATREKEENARLRRQIGSSHPPPDERPASSLLSQAMD